MSFIFLIRLTSRHLIPLEMTVNEKIFKCLYLLICCFVHKNLVLYVDFAFLLYSFIVYKSLFLLLSLVFSIYIIIYLKVLIFLFICQPAFLLFIVVWLLQLKFLILTVTKRMIMDILIFFLILDVKLSIIIGAIGLWFYYIEVI